MKTLQLFTNGSEILGIDGILYVDGRLNQSDTINAVKERNARMVNFPHKIADSFAIYKGQLRNGYGQIHKLK